MSSLFDQENNESDHLAFEIYCSDGAVLSEEDGLVWKEILREDQWAYRPGIGQKPVAVPLKVVSGSASEEGQIGMADLIEAFNDGAVDHVTVPTSHEDKPHENTGFVKKLRMDTGKGGKARLLAGIEFTEKDVEGKTKRGSIANTSVGVLFNYVKKDSGKKYGQVLGHVALTNKPWINGMQPFGVAASEDYTDDEIVPLVLASVVWNETKSLNWLRDQLSQALNEGFEEFNPYYVADISKSRALVAKSDTNGGTQNNYVVPFKVENGSIQVSEKDDWVQANKEWIKASENIMTKLDNKTFDSSTSVEVEPTLSEDAKPNGDGISIEEEGQQGEVIMADENTDKPNGDSPSQSAPEGSTQLSEEKLDEFRKEFEQEKVSLSEERDELRKKVHQLEVDKRIEQYKVDFGENQPGLLAEIRNIMLADSGANVLTLSETKEEGEATEVVLSATDIVERIVNALPKKDGITLLGEQAVSTEDTNKPPSVPEDTNLSEEGAKDRADEYAKELGLGDEYKSKDGDA